MNGHLKPVFEVLLPEIEKAHIDYWVYGGVSIAAYAGKFIRDNQDIDVFVKDIDFENAKSILDKLCKQNDFKLRSDSRATERPKIEIEIDNTERFSMIPIYEEGDKILFKYSDGNQKCPNQILERVERNISGNRFFTPRDKFIKEMFINHIKARPDKRERDKIKKDAKTILSPDELSVLGWTIE